MMDHFILQTKHTLGECMYSKKETHLYNNLLIVVVQADKVTEYQQDYNRSSRDH